MKYLNYRIESNIDPSKLCSQVTDLLKVGYEPLGGPFLKGDYFFQAVVMKKEEQA